MAQNLVVNFIGNNKLSKTTSVISNDLKKFQKTTDGVNKSLSRAFNAVGVGVGLAVLVSGLKQATKAASDDRKSQGLLALALKNTVGATSDAIAGAEKYIKRTQLSSAVLDDELRPALAKAVGATGSLASGQRVLDIALDVSAQTGAGLSQTTKALSLAYNGNYTSLKKLLPGLQTTGDVMGTVEKRFQGASETAANLDPYKRLQLIFAEIQETVGAALLPALEEFSAYLVSPEGQKNVQQIVNLFVGAGQAISNATKFLIANMGAIKAIVAALIVLRAGWALTTLAVKLYMLATGNAVKATKLLRLALIGTGIGAVIALVGVLAESWMSANSAAEDYLNTEEQITNTNTLTFENKTRIYRDPNTGESLSALATTLSDPRFTTEIKNALSKFKNELVTVDFGLNAIFVKGKMVWKGVSETVVEAAKEVRDALDKETDKVKSNAEKFRDAIGIAFGVRGTDENSIFNVDFLLGKLKRVATAAKGFAENLAKLRSKGADQSFISELVSMGPAQGNIAAKALLQSPGKLSEILGLRGELYGAGAQAQVQTSLAGNATYEININKAVISASDIIKEIRILEKKTGRKYLVN